MRRQWEYRCTEHGIVVLVESTNAKWYADRGVIRCGVCDEALRRVWSANVTTASVPGFYANTQKAPGGPGASED